MSEKTLEQRISLKQLEIDIRKELAQEHHWEQQERHWRRQAYYWIGTVIIASTAMLATIFAR